MEDVDTKVLYGTIRKELQEEGGDEGIVDFISEGEEDGNALEPPIKFDNSFPTTIFVAGLPKVNQSKYDKLLTIISKLFNTKGANEKYMPINEETGMTEGYMIVTFEKTDAETAAKELNGLRLDKSHTLKVVKMDKFDEIASRKDDFVPERTLTSFSRNDFRDWLTDRKCREQLVLRYARETEIYWYDTLEGRPVLQYGGERAKLKDVMWCDWRAHWTPQGSYLVTYHFQGIALWAGPNFYRKVRLPHQGVKAAEFSPTEEYALLWNGASHMDEEKKTHGAYALYHILTGQLVKTFRTPSISPLRGSAPEIAGAEGFPHFLWSADGKYFAECTDTRIIVRDTETFDILKDENGKPSPLKFDSLSTFQWSPKDNVIAAWTLEKEEDNRPARLVLMEIPSRVELASRSRTQCEASMHWQSEGDYLCLQVTKINKTKTKKLATNLEIFRMRQRGIPVDTVTITDTFRGFFWESKGSRFAVLTADEAGHKPKLLVFAVSRDKTEEICNFDLPSNSFNHVFWAPDGQYFVVAGTGSGGDLLFCGLNADNKLEVLYKDEHFMLNQVLWDPSSRYVITAVTHPHGNDSGSAYKVSMEAGYSIRTFQGRLVYRQEKAKLYDISWRPHPPSLLSSERQQEVRRNIKTWSKKYDAIDEQAKDAARQAFRREREEKTNRFLGVLNRLNDWKAEKEEENGWGDVVMNFMEGQGWTQDDQYMEDELDVTEELIPQ